MVFPSGPVKALSRLTWRTSYGFVYFAVIATAISSDSYLGNSVRSGAAAVIVGRSLVTVGDKGKVGSTVGIAFFAAQPATTKANNEMHKLKNPIALDFLAMSSSSNY
jgi:hypothetical protein